MMPLFRQPAEMLVELGGGPGRDTEDDDDEDVYIGESHDNRSSRPL